MTQITDDIQVKGWVTGNDEGGNLYNEVSLQDNSGAIIVAINKSGLYGLLPVGQQVVINLKDLYIGGYGTQAEIGGVYSNARTGATSIGGMDRFVFANHYMTVGRPNKAAVAALITEFDYSQASNADYIFANQGKAHAGSATSPSRTVTARVSSHPRRVSRSPTTAPTAGSKA